MSLFKEGLIHSGHPTVTLWSASALVRPMSRPRGSLLDIFGEANDGSVLAPMGLPAAAPELPTRQRRRQSSRRHVQSSSTRCLREPVRCAGRAAGGASARAATRRAPSGSHRAGTGDRGTTPASAPGTAETPCRVAPVPVLSAAHPMRRLEFASGACAPSVTSGVRRVWRRRGR